MVTAVPGVLLALFAVEEGDIVGSDLTPCSLQVTALLRRLSIVLIDGCVLERALGLVSVLKEQTFKDGCSHSDYKGEII